MKLLLIACAAVAAALTPATNDEAADEFGSIKGTVVFEGKRPEPKPDLKPTEEESKGCIHGDVTIDKEDRSLLIAEKGGLANVVLTIEVKGVEAPMPEGPVVIDQSGCRFEPHVVILPVGATLRFDNSDETNHNIHTFSRKNQDLNSMVAPATNLERGFDKAETFFVKCDIHTWMRGWVVVTKATHWDRSAADGSFEIKDLPPGTYEVSWWHETLGKGKSAEITVTAGAAAGLDLMLEAKKKKKRR